MKTTVSFKYFVSYCRLVCLLLQSLNSVLSMSRGSFVSPLPYGIIFVLMVVYSLFLSNYTSFQQTSHLLDSTSRAGRILVYSYQLQCLLLDLFGRVLSFQRSSNLVRVFYTAIRGCSDVRFFNQYSCAQSVPGAFQLDIFLRFIFTISWLISTFCILHTL